MKKRIFWLVLGVFLYGSSAFGQALNIHQTNGTISAHNLSSLEYMVFTDGYFVVSETGCQKFYYSDFFTSQLSFGENLSVTTLDNTQDELISIYPNPVDDLLHVAMEEPLNTSVRVMSVTGQLMETIESTSFNGVIDVSKLSTGIYILMVNQQTFKFIKK